MKMAMDKPRVEFVKIDMADIVSAVSCNLSTSSTQGSGEDCIGCDAAMNNCTSMMMNNQK